MMEFEHNSLGRHPMSPLERDRRVKKAFLYNDRTNKVEGNLCDGCTFENFCDFEKILPYIHKDGCNRICASNGSESVLYYRCSGAWTRLERNRLILDIDIIDVSGRDLFENENKEIINDDLGDNPDLQFWNNRRLMRHILIDIDPEHVTRYPKLVNGFSAYAKESYDLVKNIGDTVGENEFYHALALLELQFGMKLEENDKQHIYNRYYHNDDWHVCPVCKEYYFHAQGEQCSVCGWRYNLEQERDPDNKVTSDNLEQLRWRQLYYYLESQDETKEETQKIYEEYKDLFNALLKIKKALPEETADDRSVFYYGIDISRGDFGKLRKKTAAKYKLLMAKMNLEREKLVNERISQGFTEFNHPGKDTCNQLRDIRKRIAEENGIEFKPTECHHAEPCKGTCPACEAEVQYLEMELQKKQSRGEKVKLDGIAEGLIKNP